MLRATTRLQNLQLRGYATHNINHITIIGAGLMGSGIVQVAAQAGYKVTMVTCFNQVDTSEKALDNGRKIITSSLSRVAKKKHADDPALQKSFVDDVFKNISTSTDAIATVGSTDLVIEAIVENLGVKQKLFKQLDQAAQKTAIFASNTSSLPIGDIASATTRKSQFAGLHFFNPGKYMYLNSPSNEISRGH